VQSKFHGHLSNGQVRRFYREHYVDAFVNVSRTEGVPVSIMEAQSACIPVIATRVGGTPELVNDCNGVLLEPNPTPAEVANALALAIRDPRTWDPKRSAARRTWSSLSDAEVNYSAFADDLCKLIDNPSPSVRAR
jgi:glycosyltransferase involved in cell wall biosynthesis